VPGNWRHTPPWIYAARSNNADSRTYCNVQHPKITVISHGYPAADTATTTAVLIASRPQCKHLPEMIPGFGAGLVIETRSLPALTHVLPPTSTFRFAHLCRSRPRGSIHSLLPLQLLRWSLALPRARASYPSCVAVYPRDCQSRRVLCCWSLSSIPDLWQNRCAWPLTADDRQLTAFTSMCRRAAVLKPKIASALGALMFAQWREDWPSD